MKRFGLLVLACIVFSTGLWGQAAAQGSQGQGSAASSGAGKKAASGKHHHKHHHHKKQTGAKR